MKISDTPFFKTTLPNLPTSPFSWEKSGPPLFVKTLKTHTPIYKEEVPPMYLDQNIGNPELVLGTKFLI